MGFEDTATHVIWAVTIVTAAGIFTNLAFSMASDLQDAEDLRRSIDLERSSTRLTAVRFCHDPDAQELVVRATNAGRATVDTSRVSVVVDGRPNASFSATSGSNVWMPGERAAFRLAEQVSAPTRVTLVTDRGVQHVATIAPCRVLADILLTPASASLAIGETQTFSAIGYDEDGVAYDELPFVWTTDAGSLEVLNASTARLTAGTVAGTGFRVNAAVNAIVGWANVEVRPNAPVTIDVEPTPASVPAGTTQAFTAAARDEHGNVNSTAPISWSTTAGSVDSQGVLTAQTVTATARSVSATSGAASGEAEVDIVPGPVARVTITPSSATVLTSRTANFTAAAYDAYDNAVPDSVFVWTATRGNVTQIGTYTAPSTVGADTVTVTSDGISAQASVAVTRNVHIYEIRTYLGALETSTFAKNDQVDVRVSIRDHNNLTVAGASVWVEYVRPAQTVATNETAATNATGIAQTSYTLPSNAPQGDWTARVTHVTGTNLVHVRSADVVTQRVFTVSAN